MPTPRRSPLPIRAWLAVALFALLCAVAWAGCVGPGLDPPGGSENNHGGGGPEAGKGGSGGTGENTGSAGTVGGASGSGGGGGIGGSADAGAYNPDDAGTDEDAGVGP
jgi:hypothetical protein